MEFPKPTNRQTAKEKQRSRYETLIFTRLVLLVAVPLLIVGLLCGILYYRSEFARGRAKLGEVAGNASMRMTSVFDGLRSYYLAALRNSSFTWMESCSEIPYSRYSDLRDAQELLRGGTYMDSYVVGYEYINLRYGWVLSNYGTFPLEQMKNQEEIRTFIDNQASQTATLYWVNRTGAAPRQTSSLWLNVSGQCLVARITSAKNGLVGMLLIHLDMEYLSELAGEWKSLGYDVVLLDANGETVTTTDTKLAHALADAGDLSDGHLRIPGTISNYLVQGQAINFNGITCYAAYDEQQNLGSSVAAFWVSVLILLATVVVLLVCRWEQRLPLSSHPGTARPGLRCVWPAGTEPGRVRLSDLQRDPRCPEPEGYAKAGTGPAPPARTAVPAAHPAQRGQPRGHPQHDAGVRHPALCLLPAPRAQHCL